MKNDNNLPIEVKNNIPTGWQFSRSQIFISHIIKEIGNGFAIYLMYILTRKPTKTGPDHVTPKPERKLTDTQILEMFQQTNNLIREETRQRKLADAQIMDMLKQTNEKIDKLANAGLNPIQQKQVFTPEQEKRIGEIVAAAITVAIAPLVEEIKNILSETNKIKKHVGIE